MDVANSLAYVAIFCIVSVGMVLVGRGISMFTKMALIKWADRLLGLTFGLLMGFVVVSVLVLFLGMVLPHQSSFIGKSKIKPYVERMYESFYSFVPDDFVKKMKEKKKMFEEYLKKESESQGKANKKKTFYLPLIEFG